MNEERNLTEEAREIAGGIMATVAVVTEDAEWLRGLLRRAAREALEITRAREQWKDEALYKLCHAGLSSGTSDAEDLASVRRLAEEALAAVPVETQEAAEQT